MQAKILKVLLALFVVMALGVSGAQAGASPVLQQKTLIATTQVQAWDSTARGNSVYIYVRDRQGHDLTEHYVGGCATSFSGAGIFVWARIIDCAAERSPIRFRYLSVGGRQAFTVKLTTHELLPG